MAYESDIDAMFACLYDNEIKSVEATFAGSSDSGQIDQITAINLDNESVAEKELRQIIVSDYEPDNADDFGTWHDGRWNRRNFKIKPLTLLELVETVAYRELEMRHSGWEIDAGSSGTVEMFVPRKNDGTLGRSTADNISIDLEYGYDEEYDDDEEDDE